MVAEETWPMMEDKVRGKHPPGGIALLIVRQNLEENLRQNHSSDGGFGLRFGDVQLPTGVVHGFADLQSAGAEG